MKYREFAFKSCTGKNLSAYSWEIECHQEGERPKGNIVLVHGLGEYVGRYREMATFLTERGYNVHGFDLAGFGKSPGKRGHISSFDLYFQDLRQFVSIHNDCWEGQKTILMGNSMGGVLSLAFVIQFPGLVDGLVVSSPALKALPIPGTLDKLVSLCNRFLPWLAFSNRLQTELLSRDSQVGEMYRKDPLIHDRITPRFFTELTSWMDYTLSNAHLIADPLLLLYAGDDQIVNPQGSEELASRLSPDLQKEVVCYGEMYHEIWNELEKEQVWEKIVNWIDSVLISHKRPL